MIFVLLAIFLAGCKPFEISASVEPNNLTGSSSRSFDVAVSLEPEVADTLQTVFSNESTGQNGQDGQTTESTQIAPAKIPIPTSNEPIAMAGEQSKGIVAESAQSAPTYPAFVTQVGLNVRSGPGTNYPKIGGLPIGATAQIVGKSANGEWWQIGYPIGSAEWAWISGAPGFGQPYNVAHIPIVEAPSLPQPRLLIHSDLGGANNLVMLNLDGSKQAQIHNGEGSDNVYATVSPNGQRVAFVSDRDGNQEIYVVNIDGSSLRRLTYTSAPDKWPVWSPDGQRIAFDSERDGNREIYVMHADGSGVFRVTNHWAEDGAPAWSPDGKELVFHSDRDGNHEIYVMQANGSNVQRLTYHPGNEWTPSWSPDGSRIAFVGYHDSQSAEIFVMDVNGENQRNLTNHPAEDAVPVWSPDGRQIAFESRRDGHLQVYVMNSDGSNPLRVTSTQSNDGRPAWVAP